MSQFDAKTRQYFTSEVVGPSYAQRIEGDGYFIIVNPNSEYASFSKKRHDICFGDIVSDIIHNYTNQQYANDYGSRHLGGDLSEWTVREYLQRNLGMDIV